MCVVQVPSLVLQSKYVLRIWCNGVGFAFKHCLPDYLPLCGGTFLIRTLVYMIILPMSHKNLFDEVLWRKPHRWEKLWSSLDLDCEPLSDQSISNPKNINSPLQ